MTKECLSKVASIIGIKAVVHKGPVDGTQNNLPKWSKRRGTLSHSCALFGQALGAMSP